MASQLKKETGQQWRVCTAIMAVDTKDALLKMKTAVRNADLLEIRLDAMREFDLSAIFENSRLPLVVTYRSPLEGGLRRTDDETRALVLKDAIEKGADFVDLELTMPPDLKTELCSLTAKTKIIISHHLFQPCPLDVLKQSVEKIFEQGPDIGKLIGYAQTWDDNLDFLSLVRKATARGRKLICFGMGPFGRPGRIMAPAMGAPWTYAALSSGQESAPGQMTAFDLRQIWDKIDAD